MLVLRLFIVCSACFWLLAAPTQVTAQLLNRPESAGADKTAKSEGVISAQVTEKESKDSSAVKQTNWYSVPMPKITMPKIEIPRFSMPSFMASDSGSSTAKPSMFAPLTAGAHKISDGSKKAWEGAKDMFRFGRGQSKKPMPQSDAAKRPSLWERMFTPKEPEGPRTVAEWMSQPRLDP